MRTSCFFVLIFLSNYCFSQGDDFPDYRSKKDVFAHIQEKEIKNDVASFSFGGLDESVGKLALKTVPLTAVGSNFISFAGDNISVKITAAPFNAAKHKIGYYEKFVTKIDNKPYFGDYGKVPKTIIESVVVAVDRDTITIPPVAYTDLYNPIFSYNEAGVQKTLNNVYLSAKGNRIYIYLLKKETGGSYEVTWVIQDKKYLRRVVDFGFLK